MEAETLETPTYAPQKAEQATVNFLRRVASTVNERMSNGVEDYETILNDAVASLLKRARELEARCKDRHRNALRRTSDLASLSNKVIERINEVAALVATHYGVDMYAIMRARKIRALMVPRYTTYWLCRQAISYVRLADLGLVLHRDHSSVLYGIQKAEEWRDTDPTYKATTDNLLSQVTRD